MLRLLKIKPITILAFIILSGCTSPTHGKTADELLSLSVSGLSGVDRYAFSGITGIVSADAGNLTPVSFQGIVEDHNQIRVQSDGNIASTGIIEPLDLLNHVQASAKNTEIVNSESGARTAMLMIETDDTANEKYWRENIRNEFHSLQRKAAEPSVAAIKDGHHSASLNAFRKEWAAELEQSGRQLDQMLSTLRVHTTYKLLIDKTRMLPLRLQEHSVLHYKTGAGQMKETRNSDISFRTLQ
ncbi:hypothetical protein KZ483_12700 [Paenibacillus sp. sptzw28]|uniref:hypothetical protein n=1 Tax=Paenibacillus sp. sptzw28 TaxID=715179 RepID=UPI001C6EAD65|nr:hypothetical protein [Paenibacillus sp. sptzw28]QYR23671.1 hypothetical protein KZ483_12700 [Paenibacillus sp. sptzw28]